MYSDYSEQTAAACHGFIKTVPELQPRPNSRVPETAQETR